MLACCTGRATAELPVGLLPGYSAGLTTAAVRSPPGSHRLALVDNARYQGRRAPDLHGTGRRLERFTSASYPRHEACHVQHHAVPSPSS